MIKKCLKGLCILWLTLLPVSFSNSSFETLQVWDLEFYWNYGYVFDYKFNWHTNN